MLMSVHAVQKKCLVSRKKNSIKKNIKIQINRLTKYKIKQNGFDFHITFVRRSKISEICQIASSNL